MALAVAVAVAFADSSIVVLALPELYVQFETTIPRISWVITTYNVAVVVGVLALLAVARRVRPRSTALAGLAIFLAASVACALAGDLSALVAGRTAQGLGAALLLGASLPLMVGLSGARERAVAVWVGAGTLGTAVGPALGGLLTEAFDWRAIFAVQAPVAAAALAAALHPRTRGLPVLTGVPARIPLGAALGLVLLFAALVGALFLAVLLLVTVWDHGPLAGASIVSALPLAALAARPLSRRLPGRADVASGCALLAGGLAALALLPASDPLYAVLALVLSGAGLGLALPPLTRASLPEEGELARSGVLSVGLRHLGLVVGLVAVAPLLAVDLDEAGDRATQNATAVILDARLPLQQKIPIALDLYDAFQRTPEGEIPDLAAPFEANGADRERGVREARDSLLTTVEAALTRGFRSSFALSALFALLACAAVLAVGRKGAT
ncbi:MAG: MFS transporter [Gaiellaceae bacterium]